MAESNIEPEGSNLVPIFILRFFTSIIGWSAAGRRVLVRIDDTYEEALKDRQFRGRVVRLTSNGNALILLENPIKAKGKDLRNILAVPRHHGYDFNHLWWGSIAVNLINSVEMDDLKKPDAWIAIASIKIN